MTCHKTVRRLKIQATFLVCGSDLNKSRLLELGCRFQLDGHDEFAGGSKLQIAATTHLKLARFAAA
jgi:hypothetical protein